jgi:hypothetical protein
MPFFDTDHTQTGCTVTEYLKKRIETDFNVFDVPDAFFFLPEKLGGLGLRNPFVSIFMLRDRMKKSPRELMIEYLKSERELYEVEKGSFDKKTATQRRRTWENMESNSEPDELKEAFSSHDKDIFLSFEEWSKFREARSFSLSALYNSFMDVPSSNYPATTRAVEDAVSAARQKFGLGTLGAEVKWTLYLYAEDLLAKFGGLNLVDRQFLPIGVLDMIKGKKVRWQMVL